MQQDSASNLYKLRNVYDNDLTIIPKIVDSALSHFFIKQLHKPMNLEIRIVPEIQNRRNVTLLIGDKESIEVDEKKVYPGDENIVSPYRYDQSMHNLYMRSTTSSTSTAKPIGTTIR
uniref:Bm10290 n=1 Tax=Brugia malayi TaxID=6279 RepID=A0A0I9N8G7_BRUMA|nr:Bm10290 [Brugia malayi]